MPQRIHIYLVVIAAVFGVLLCFWWVLGRAQLDYFSPDTLVMKTESELLLPVTGASVFRSRPDYHRNELVEYLIAEGYWSPRPTNAPRWFLTAHLSDQWRDGHSDLHRQLMWRRSFWREWTEEHPDIAAVLWPLVLDVLRSEEDSFDDSLTGEIMYHAKNSTTLDEFKTLIANDPELKDINAFKN